MTDEKFLMLYFKNESKRNCDKIYELHKISEFFKLYKQLLKLYLSSLKIALICNHKIVQLLLLFPLKNT